MKGLKLTIKNIFYGWWVVFACFIITLYVSGVVFFGFTAFFEPLIQEFGWSYTEVSFAASLRGLEMGIFAPLIGFIVDRLSSRKLILAGNIIIGFALILLSLTRSLSMFYASFLLLALGAGGCMNVVTMSAVTNWFDKDVGKALGVMSSGIGASGLMVPFIVWLIDILNWRTALIILGVGMWILGIPVSFLIRDNPGKNFFPSHETLPKDPVLPQEVQSKNVEISLKDALKNKSFLYLNFIEAIRFMIVSAIATHMMPYLSTTGMSRQAAGLVAAALPLFSIIGRVGFGWLSDLFEKKYVLALTFFFMGAGLIGFCYVQLKWIVLLFLLLFPPGFGGGVVLRGAILKDYSGRGSFGKMFGIVTGSASIGGIIGPTIAGWGFDTMRSYHFVWLMFLGLVGIAIILILKMELKVNPAPRVETRDFL